jgi:hypothetical protein
MRSKPMRAKRSLGPVCVRKKKPKRCGRSGGKEGCEGGGGLRENRCRFCADLKA